MSFIESFEPQALWKHFDQILTSYRPSKGEERMRNYVASVADNSGLPYKIDATGNIVVSKPASPGRENATITILQSHLDMVLEKNSDVDFDFSTDPIQPRRDGEYLNATGTTLGSDNGIGMAAMLALMESTDVAHGPLELLFTVDEETGLIGVNKLPADFIKGSILLNVDSEDEGVFTVGCAGGTETLMTRDFKLEKVPGDHVLVEISAGGMRGGHSGIDIGKHRANANKVLARLLEAAGKCDDLRLVALEGGSKHNAIPREARATVSMPAGALEETEKRVRVLAEDIASEFQATERNLAILFEKQAAEGEIQALSPGGTREVTALLLITPNGVIETVPGQTGQVETSCNLAIIGLEGDRFTLLVSQRSSVMSRLEAINTQVEAAAALAGAATRTNNQYPAWPVKPNSPLLKRCRQVYTECFGNEPFVEIIHAGLECAVIGAKYPDMEMISFGPTMKNPHSPGEKLNVPSMGKLWDFLVALMKSFRPDAP